jgi:hypothetical protein
MIDQQTRVVFRRFDAARDAESLRKCVIDHQNFHHNAVVFAVLGYVLGRQARRASTTLLPRLRERHAFESVRQHGLPAVQKPVVDDDAFDECRHSKKLPGDQCLQSVRHQPRDGA